MRADSVAVARRDNQSAGGGSIPASALFFRLGEVDDATALVKRFHYSRRWASNVQVAGTFHESGGLFGDCGPAVAACVFAIPPTRWSEDVIELSRLVRADDKVVPLTKLISLTVSAVRRHGWSLAVSFADVSETHVGYVYQAASWNYHGCREPRMDGVYIDGTFIPGRSANSAYGTRSPRLLKERFGIDATAAMDDGKHLYWKALNRDGESAAERLKLCRNAYPKRTLENA